MALMIAIVAIVQRVFDSHATVIIAFFAGIIDLRSIALAIASFIVKFFLLALSFP